MRSCGSESAKDNLRLSTIRQNIGTVEFLIDTHFISAMFIPGVV